jgi:maleamate amidohydrolase
MSTLFSPEDQQVLDAYRRAKPAEWDLTAPALLVVDVVESFVGRDVPVVEAQRDGVTACGEKAWRALGPMAELVAAFRAAGRPVLYSTIKNLPSSGSGGRAGTLRPDTVVEQVAPREGEAVFPKPRPSMFFATPLLATLVAEGIREVVVVGGATSGCVRSTVLDAFSNSFTVILPKDACFDRVDACHDMALFELDLKYARVTSTSDVVARLG